MTEQKKGRLLSPPKPIKKTQNNSFQYSKLPQSDSLVHISSKRFKNDRASLSKDNGRSIKITTDILDEINLLGSFIDESVVHKIIGELIDSYIENEFTDRQQKQFFFLLNKNL